MDLYEYEGKKLFREVGIRVPEGRLVRCMEDLDGFSLSCQTMLVKAQVLRGSRGKAHLIVEASDEDSLVLAAKSLLGKRVGSESIQAILVEEKLLAEREIYLAVTYHGSEAVLLASAKGGGRY